MAPDASRVFMTLCKSPNLLKQGPVSDNKQSCSQRWVGGEHLDLDSLLPSLWRGVESSVLGSQADFPRGEREKRMALLTPQ